MQLLNISTGPCLIRPSTYLISGNVSNASLVEQLFIGPIRMLFSQSRCPPIVMSEPHDPDAE